MYKPMFKNNKHESPRNFLNYLSPTVNILSQKAHPMARSDHWGPPK